MSQPTPPAYTPPQTPSYQSPPPSSGSAGGLGIAALVCGIIGIVFAIIPCLSWLGVLLGLVGVVLGAIAWVNVNKTPGAPKGVPMAGTIISAAAVVLGVVVWVVIAVFLSTAAGGLEEFGRELERASEEARRQFDEAQDRQGVITAADTARQQIVSEARAAGVADSQIDAAVQNFDAEMSRLQQPGVSLEDARQRADMALEDLRRALAAGAAEE